MQTPLNLIISHFFEYRNTIRTLYSADDDFKTLCEDYHTSKMNIQKLKEKLMEERDEKIEFEQLSLELEKEILEYLKKMG